MTTPTSPDFRALCAELVSSWDDPAGDPDFCDVADAMDRARAALEAQPEPVGPDFWPSEDDVTELFYRHVGEGSEVGFENAIAEALTRWGRPAIEPIPVSERLPTEADCDAEDQCWLWRTDGIEEFWELVVPPNKLHEYNWTSQWKYTHWLPHWALPIPRSEEK